ncbi:hypothetical protein PYCCODRAFT_1462277 [Trametes coccinea BRFM310]|uniref:Uncharacterized protein n=1 Tax=Trametes coccinea (strain BRFM310) TaxID=1353009 RepID=A0A1Y2I8E7_TRAC3|nr:hypothetical protein PYCCODRAFT_1462277 [Trametes coccinea BRFM310]
MKTFCPLSRQYAVIQMDPVGMVRHFEDPIALAAAQAMKPQKYLVYLEFPRDLSTPARPWFRYDVSLIGNTLRSEEPEYGITSEMVIPIHPNTYRTSDNRAPVRTQPPFPFDNCFHWIESGLIVRVRRKATRYDDANAYKLNFYEQMEMDKKFLPDHMRIEAFLRARADEAGEADLRLRPHTDSLPHQSFGSRCQSTSPGSDIESRLGDDVDSLPEGPGAPNDSDDTDDSDPASPRTLSPDDNSAADIVEAFFKMDILGFNVDDTAELMPLVDLWFELTDHLTAETIPNPMDLHKEHEEIMRIIHDARERAPSIRAPFIDNGVEIDYDALSSVASIDSVEFCRNERALVPPDLRLRYGLRLDDEEPASDPPSRPQPRRCHVLTVWRTFRRTTAKCLQAIVPWRNHRPPCLPYWS